MGKSDLSTGGIIAAGLTALALFCRGFAKNRNRRRQAEEDFFEEEEDDVEVQPVRKVWESKKKETSKEEVPAEEKPKDDIPKEEKEETYEVNSPFFKEAILTAITKDPEEEEENRELVNPDYFYNPKLNTIISGSKNPIIRIIPCMRFDEDLEEKVPAKRLDILFPVPQALVIKGINMGLYTNISGQTELSGKTKLESRTFFYAFGGNKKAGDAKKVEYMGYIPKLLLDECVPYYPTKDIEVRKEGYFNVSYVVYDPKTRSFVRQHRLYCGTDSRAMKDILTTGGKNDKSKEELMNKFLTEVYEKYVLAEEVVEIPENIIDPVRLDRKAAEYIVKDQTEIEDVILTYRVSFYLADEDYPCGITPYGLSEILLYMSTKLDINERYDADEDKRYKYCNPWLIEEWPYKKGELNVLTIVDPDADEFELKSIPIIPRKYDRQTEREVAELYPEVVKNSK